MDMSQLAPQKSQADIQSADHWKISGQVLGTCEGLVRVDAIETTDLGAAPDGGEVAGPITAMELDAAPSAFELLVPKGLSIQLTALCDGNRDQKIKEGEDKLSLGARLGAVTGTVEGVELTLEDIRPPGGGGPGSGGPGAPEGEEPKGVKPPSFEKPQQDAADSPGKGEDKP